MQIFYPDPVTLAGSTISGSGPPTDDIGIDGQTYVDVDSNFTYGPKGDPVPGSWPVGIDVALPRA